MTELSKIAQNYLTDKGNTYINSHCYTEIYDQYFQKYKEENRTSQATYKLLFYWLHLKFCFLSHWLLN